MKMMLDEGCEYCVMEVSSVAVDLFRIDELDFDYGVFTNITSDHMDYHKTFENYFIAKKRFFNCLKPEAKIIANCDDPHWVEMVKDSKAKIITYGKKDSSDYKIDSTILQTVSFVYSTQNNKWAIDRVFGFEEIKNIRNVNDYLIITRGWGANAYKSNNNKLELSNRNFFTESSTFA